MDGTTRALVASLLVSLSGTACSFTQAPDAKSVQLPKTPADSSVADDQTPNLDVQFAVARTFEQERDLDRAADLYRAILAQDSSHAGATHRLAIICDQQGRYEESRKLFQRALELRPGNADLYCDLGYSLYCQQQWAQAERHLRLALEADPQHQRAHHHLGMTLAAQAKDGVALREFQKSGCSAAQAHASLAQMQTFTGRLDEAARNCELARKADPRNEEIAGQLRQVEELLAKAAQQTTTSPETIVAQKAAPEPSSIWRVGFERKTPAEPQPTPAATSNTATRQAQTSTSPEPLETSPEPKETTSDSAETAPEPADASLEQADASTTSDQSGWRRVFRWRRADKTKDE